MRPRSASLRVVLCAAAGVWGMTSATALAQTGNRIGDALLGSRGAAERQAVPVVARYVAGSNASFTLDKSSPQTILLRFDNSPEVWVLRGRPAPMGDVVYVNDLGVTVLRATRLGGLILYTSVKPEGLPASLSGAAQPIQPFAKIDMQGARQRIAEANKRMAFAAQRPTERGFGLDIPPVKGAANIAIIVDTVSLVADAFERTAKRAGGLDLLNKVDGVQVVMAEGASSVVLKDGVLRVSVQPQEGVAGRPSSDRLIVALIGR